MSEFTIDYGVPPPSPARRGRPRKRNVAANAADAVRQGKFDCVFDAARAYFPQHVGFIPSHGALKHELRERFKEFVRYIVEDLKTGPRSMHVYRALSRHTIKRNQQAAWKSKRYAFLLGEFQRAIAAAAE